jgi:uncharacterized protein
MKCPIDDTELMMSERSNVEVDYCPKCRGVWLDRGELDKIVARVEKELPNLQDGYNPQDRSQNHQSDYRKNGHQKRRKSWMSELFD